MILTREYLKEHLPIGMRLSDHDSRPNKFFILYNMYQIDDDFKEGAFKGSAASLNVDNLPSDSDTKELFKARLKVALRYIYLADVELCEKALEYKRKKLREFNQAA